MGNRIVMVLSSYIISLHNHLGLGTERGDFGPIAIGNCGLSSTQLGAGRAAAVRTVVLRGECRSGRDGAVKLQPRGSWLGADRVSELAPLPRLFHQLFNCTDLTAGRGDLGSLDFRPQVLDEGSALGTLQRLQHFFYKAKG